MRRLAGMVAFSILLAGALWGQRGVPFRRQQTSVDLQVRVVWQNDHPVSGEMLRVDVETFGGGVVASAFTNTEGGANFGQLPPGNYTLRVSGADIQAAEANIYLDPKEGLHFESIRVERKEKQPAAAGGAATVSAADLNVPDKARKEFEKGNQEAKKRNWTAAEAHYREALKIYPRYAMAFNNLGVMLQTTGDQAGAQSAFESALKINDHYAQAYLNLGRLLYSQGQTEPAAAALGKLVAVDPIQPEGLLLLASAELSLGKFEQAAAHALRVHGLQQPACVAAGTCPATKAVTDQYPAAHFVAGRALELTSKPGDAAAQFKLYLAEVPEGPLAEQAREELSTCEKAGPQAASAPHD